jgi:copper resistance protein B
MSRRLLIGAVAPLFLAAPAYAQIDHSQHGQPAPDPHAGHAMPAAPAADPHAGHAMPPVTPAAADPHAGHVMPAPPAADPHAGHAMPAAPAGGPVGDAPPPPIPTDRAAERFYSREAMQAARDQLAKEHGGSPAWKVMLSTAEVRPDDDAYAWSGEAWHGGDLNRFVLKSEGEGERGGDLHSAEVQALYSRAIGPYFDLQAGVRHDFEPGPSRTYATIGFEGVAPYWFELEGAAFLSNKGDLSARFEGAYDLRLTQKLILEPRAEIELSAQDVRELGVGSGLTRAELGLRLRYEFRREFGPYVGVVHERKFGRTADMARAAGEDRQATSFVVGVRAWF